MTATATLAALALAALPAVVQAQDRATLPVGLEFASIDGGRIAMDDYAGQAVLVVNTASLCGFAPQFTALQALHDRYGDAGLVVLAVPSDDFNQELGGDAEVKAFCELTYGIDMPMTTITAVLGDGAHPLYRWLADSAGFVPAWNFSKVLIGRDGMVAGQWGGRVAPGNAAIITAIDAALTR